MSESDSEYTDVDSQEEQEQEEITDLSNDAVVTKYRMASDICNKALKDVAAACVAGAKVVDLCELGDSIMQKGTDSVFQKAKVEKGIAFPTCIGINNCVGHFSPLQSDPEVVLKDGDVVKIDLGCQIDGYVAMGAHTVVVGATGEVTGRAADAIAAVNTAAEAVHRLLRPGTKGSEITDAIAKIAAEFNVNPIEGTLSHQIKHFVVDGNKCFPSRKSTEYKFDDFEVEANEVYGIDLVFSTGEGKPKEREARTTVFKRRVENTYDLKIKASRQLFGEVNRRFPAMLFTLRAIADEKLARAGIVECIKHDLVAPYPVLYEHDGDIVVQLKFTALVMPSTTHRVTGLPAVAAKSEHTVKDEAIVALLTKSVKKSRGGKKKKAAAAAAAPAEAK